MGFERIPSPIDEMQVPERLTARVVAPGAQPRIHGYDVQSDLAKRYRFAEVVLLSLVGEAPSRVAGDAFEIWLSFAAPVSVAEAPVHAAALARRCAAKPSSVSAVAAIGLAEQARHQLDSLDALFTWLNAGREGPAPRDDADEGTARLHAALRSVGFEVAPDDRGLSLLQALISVGFDLGLVERWQLEAALCTARWPLAIAEAMRHPHGDVRSYPIRLPAFEIGRHER